MAASKPNSWADIATKGHYKEQRRKIEQLLQSNATEVEVTEKCAESIVKPYSTGTEKSKSHGLMVTLGTFGHKGKGKTPQQQDAQDTTKHDHQETGRHNQVLLQDYLEKSRDSFDSSGSQNDYQRAIEEMFQNVQESHNINSANLLGETAEVELDFEKEFPALGNSSDNDGIVLGSRSFYQMKRSAEKMKQPDDSNKKVLKLYDGSLYFGDETNLSVYDLQKDGAKKVEDDYEGHTPITMNNPEMDFDRSEWEVNSNVELDDELHIKDNDSAWEKGIPDELVSKCADNDCDNEDTEDVNGFTYHTDSDEIVSTKEEEPIWGIDNSLVNAPTCVFDVTVLPEQWLTNDLQGWIPEDKIPHKDKTDTQGEKAQSSIGLASSQKGADVVINDNTDKRQETDGKPNMESHSENEKLESGVESNTEVTSDNDHCDETLKSFRNKHCHIMGSTDDSNRSSPPSESNASSDSEDASGPPSIADLNYDTDDLAHTWGSRCPSPEPDDNLFGFALPTPADVLDNFIQQTNEEIKSNDLPNDVNGEATQDNTELESTKEALDKEDCDKTEAKIVETEKSSSKDLEIMDNSPDQLKDLINTEKNDICAKDDNHHSISDKENVEGEPSGFEMKRHERQRNPSPDRSRDQALEGKESLKIFTPRKKIDSSSGLSRDSSPCRQKQSRAHQNTNDSNSTDINKNIDTLSKGNTSPKLTRRRKRRQTAVKRKPETVEKKVEMVVAEKKTELAETKSEITVAPPTIPSMTLTDMTRLPLSDIIAIGKSMEPLKESYSDNSLQNKPAVEAQSVREKQSSPLKLVLPKEQKCDKSPNNVSPERRDEYSTWDSQEWNPFEGADQKEMAFVTSHHQIAQDLTTKFNIPSSVDGQSDTDSGHWTAAHEERSSHRSSPRTTIYTPTDRLSVQSEAAGETKMNDPASVTANFSSASHAQSPRVSTYATVDSNSQQTPSQFASAMPPTSMPNMQQTPWFNMAMQCWAQQCMAAQQMQLMASQVQPSNSINPWMMPNQTNSNPMASLQGQSGMMNQMPPEILAQMSGGIPNQMQSGMMNPLPQGMSSHMPSTEAINQMQAGMGFMNQRQSGISTMPGTYYGPHQQNTTNITSISSGMAPSAMMANPGTSITVTRPEKNAQSPYVYTQNPMPSNHEQVRIAKAPALSSNLVSTSTLPTGGELKKQHRDNAPKTQNVRVTSAKRCDVIKVSSLLKEEEDDIAEGKEKEDEIVVTEVEDDEDDDDDEKERIEGEEKVEEEESDEDESFHETFNDTRTRVSKNNINTKRTGSAKKRSSLKGIRKCFASNSIKFMLIFQTLFILVVSIILYKGLDV